MSALRPRLLEDLPPQALRRVVGIMTDIDDTLTAAGRLDPPALDALLALRAAQFPVIAITGRPLGWSEPFARTWPVEAIVAENGAVALIARRGQVLRPRRSRRWHPSRTKPRASAMPSACARWRSVCCAKCPAPCSHATAPAA